MTLPSPPTPFAAGTTPTGAAGMEEDGMRPAGSPERGGSPAPGVKLGSAEGAERGGSWPIGGS